MLFDGKSADAFKGGKMTEDGLLMQGCTSKQKFGSCKVHIEFRTPYQPEDRGQARGNSGIYVGARYECQMLDSFGLKGENNECGGLYSVKAPDVNMCLPPLAWQTYDIDYTAAKYEGDKLVTQPARDDRAQRRRHPQRRRAARRAFDDRRPQQARAGAGADLPAGSRQPAAVSEYLGRGEEVVVAGIPAAMDT